MESAKEAAKRDDGRRPSSAGWLYGVRNGAIDLVGSNLAINYRRLMAGRCELHVKQFKKSARISVICFGSLFSFLWFVLQSL